MQRSNLIDVPRLAGADDLLGIDKYTHALTKFISTANMPITLAIQGEWGSGKTSLMNQVKYHLCDDTENIDTTKPYHGIWINTWQYSLMKSPEQIILSVIEGITNEIFAIMKNHHGKKIDNAINKVSQIFGKIAKAGTKAAASTIGVDGKIVDELLSSGDSHKPNPEQFKRSLTEAIRDCLKEDKKNGHNTKGFLFFIDDLDRLDPFVAVNILELLKNLFEVDNCIFILAIDYEVVVKGLQPKFGELTEKNEREFRSFFDKIIQLPFTMPVSAYTVNTYLQKALITIDYYSEQELNAEINDDKVIEILSNMILLSTGSNPRSVKRLINSLSLIKIMHETTNTEQLSNVEKLINFGFVCLQIAYPTIYSMLLHEPNFRMWDNKLARHFRLKVIDNSVKEVLEELEEFDEEWEQVLYRACAEDSFLSSRSLSISKLLNLISELVPENLNFEDEIEKILGLASVTTVSANLIETKQQKRVRLENLEDFYKILKSNGVKEDIINLWKIIINNIQLLFEDLIEFDISPTAISVISKSAKSRERLLVRFFERQNSIYIYTDKYKIKFKTIEEGTPDGLPKGFYAYLRRIYNGISSVQFKKDQYENNIVNLQGILIKENNEDIDSVTQLENCIERYTSFVELQRE